MNIGIEDDKRKELVASLSRLLADTYFLMLNTQNVHWNVTGPMFHSVHTMTELQYNQLFLDVDLLAERIRALGEPAPASYAEYTKLAAVKELGREARAEYQLRALVESRETAARTARDVVGLAENAKDTPTADLVTGMIESHQKTAWMMRSLLG